MLLGTFRGAGHRLRAPCRLFAVRTGVGFPCYVRGVGPQGVYQCHPGSAIQSLWRRYTEPGDYPDFVVLVTTGYGLFPGCRLMAALRVLSLNKIPFCARALALPATRTYAKLCRAVQHQTGWEVAQSRVPPAEHAWQIKFPTEPLSLRDGDVLDVLASRRDCRDYDIRSQSEVKDHVLWTRGMVLNTQIIVRLWAPDLPQPILTWLEAGERWDPVDLTFSGGFASRFPGCWALGLGALGLESCAPSFDSMHRGRCNKSLMKSRGSKSAHSNFGVVSF